MGAKTILTDAKSDDVAYWT